MTTSTQVKNKMVELTETLSFIPTRYGTKKRKVASCFISYCWSNSKTAVNIGTKYREGAIGKTDPRDLKKQLEDAGISCWMDIEQVGQTGLIQDITEGLKRAKVVIACVSDEYVTSKNCQMEFRFASMTLRIPILIAVVGTGVEWMRSEIGMLAINYPKVDLQYRIDENKEILKFVGEHITDKEAENTVEEPDRKIKVNELIELIERKFLHNILSLHNTHNVSELPHLPVLDLDEDSTEKKISGFRFVFLCECDEGWHLPKEAKSIKWDVSPDDQDTKDKILEWSPYLSRIYTLLRETDIPLVSLRLNLGYSFLQKIFKACSLSTDNFDDELTNAYVSMLKTIRNHKSKKIFLMANSYVKKCQIGNGNKVWLCENHQKFPKVKILEVTEEYDTGEGVDKFYDDMLDTIQNRKSEEARGKFIGAEVAVEAANHLEKQKVKESHTISDDGRTKSRACIIS